MVTNAPNTEIPLITGEIGQASLTQSKMYYNMPAILYKTSRGDVTLFADECMPVDRRELELCLEEGGTITKDGRYLPNKEIVREIAYAFGSRVGLGPNWEESYDDIISSAPNSKINTGGGISETKAMNEKRRKEQYHERT